MLFFACESDAPATRLARQADGVFKVPTRRSASRCRTVEQDEIMRNLIGLGMVLCGSVACTTPAASQPAPTGPLDETTTTSSASAPCTMVEGTADVDGTPQNISGLACKQPDGTWQIQQQDPGVEADNAFPYYDPWSYGPPVVFGFGASFVFVDRFHNFHHMDHPHFGPHRGFGSRGGFHAGFHGGNGSHGGGGFHGRRGTPLAHGFIGSGCRVSPPERGAPRGRGRRLCC